MVKLTEQEKSEISVCGEVTNYPICIHGLDLGWGVFCRTMVARENKEDFLRCLTDRTRSKLSGGYQGVVYNSHSDYEPTTKVGKLLAMLSGKRPIGHGEESGIKYDIKIGHEDQPRVFGISELAFILIIIILLLFIVLVGLKKLKKGGTQ